MIEKKITWQEKVPHQIFSDSLVNLRLLGRRSILALTGIVVGTASVVALLNVGSNAAREMMRTFESLGADVIVVSFPARTGTPDLPPTLSELEIINASPSLVRVAVLSTAGMTLSRDKRFLEATVLGSTPSLGSTLNLRTRSGRLLSHLDAKLPVAVVGAELTKELGIETSQEFLVGRTQIRISNSLYYIVGLVDPTEKNPFLPVDLNNSIVVPIEGLRRLQAKPQITAIVARTINSRDINIAVGEIRSYLISNLPGRDFDIRIPQQLLEEMQRQSKTLSYLLAGLGGISLLIGGIGIMNVMLMNIHERRREIGIRMVLGARPRDIRLLFLFEAAILTCVGAALGATVGVLAAYIFSSYSGWVFTLNAWSVLLGIGSSITTGVFFGLHPAVIASRLLPARALSDV